MRRALGALLLTLVSLVIFVGLVELGVRLHSRSAIVYDIEMTRYANEIKIESENPRIGHIHRPGASAILMGVPVEINSDGQRDRDYPVERTQARRIVVLGDSLTFAWGVPREQSFEFLLEEDLARHAPTELINFGVGNYNTDQQVTLFLEEGLKYEPDEVLLFYFINDAEPTPQKSRWALLGHSRAFTFFWSRAKALASRFSKGRSFRDYYADLYAEGAPGWETTKTAFLTLRDTARERGFGLRVLLLPELHRVQDSPFAAEYAQVSEFLEQNGIAHFDLTPAFGHVSDPMSLWVAPDDAHPNARAHEIIADAALPLLLDRPSGE